MNLCQPNCTRENNPIQDQYTATERTGQPQPATMLKRIGATTYRVRVHFSGTNSETMSDKILRMVKNEAVSE